jgi:hypothetical protein
MNYTKIIMHKIKNSPKIFLWAIALMLLSNISSGQTKNDTLRLFVIGNSFSQNATAYLPEIAKEKGKNLVIGRAELGGHSLEQHWKYAEAAEANPASPEGKPYKGKSLRTLLSEGKWNIVTIQQYSYLSADKESYNPYAQKLYDFIKNLQPKAEVVLHQTWAYRWDAKTFGRTGKGQLAKNEIEMWQKSRDAYHTLASQLKVRIIPVGDAFKEVTSSTAYPYKKDLEFDYVNPVYPNLPNQTNSLNMGYYWKNNKEFTFDANHANEAGRYLGSLIWYAFIFNDSPENVQFVPKQVPADFAKYLREVAAKIVKNSGEITSPAK